MRKKFFISILLISISLIGTVLIAQQFNPTLSGEQEGQLREYREILSESIVKPVEVRIEKERFLISAVEGLLDWLGELANNSRSMYSPLDSPFNKKVVESSDERAFTATAGRRAVPDTYRIEVIQTASGDVLVSENVSRDLRLEEAEFYIISGDRERRIRFAGGNIQALERAINRYAESIVRARAIRRDIENYVLVIDGLLTGESNKLLFDGDTTPLEKIGMLHPRKRIADDKDVSKKVDIADDSKEIDKTEIDSREEHSDIREDIKETPQILENIINPNSVFTMIEGEYFKVQDRIVNVMHNSIVELDLPEDYIITKNSILEFRVQKDIAIVDMANDELADTDDIIDDEVIEKEIDEEIDEEINDTDEEIVGADDIIDDEIIEEEITDKVSFIYPSYAEIFNLSKSDVKAGDTQELKVDNVGVIEEPYNNPFLPITYVPPKREIEDDKDIKEDATAKTDEDKDIKEDATAKTDEDIEYIKEDIDLPSKDYIIGMRNKDGSIVKKLMNNDRLSIIQDNDESWTTFNFSLSDYFDAGTEVSTIIFYNNYEVSKLFFKDLKIYAEDVDVEEDIPIEEKIVEDEEIKDVVEDTEIAQIEEDEIDDFMLMTETQGNFQSRARDAIINYGGVRIYREKNEIDDIIDGVTLNIRRPTDGVEELTIDHDYEAVFLYIRDFVDYNNLIMTYIYNVTRYNRDKTENDLLELYRGDNMTAQEYREAAFYGEVYERLLYNDRDVYRLRSELRMTMMGVYETAMGDDISMLIDIGINSKDYERRLENPILEIDESKFKEVLEANFDTVKEFFYRDSNGDGIVNAGLAYTVYRLLEVYRERRVVPQPGVVYPGPLYGKIQLARDRIRNYERDLDKAKEDVDKKVNELRVQFVRINQAKAEQESMQGMFGGLGGGMWGSP